MHQHIMEFARNKVEIARRLNAGECDCDYYEASSILSGLISAISALMWPRQDGIDRMRFVELLVNSMDHELRGTHISIPLLSKGLLQSKTRNEQDWGDMLRVKFLPPLDDQIVTGDEVDMPECDVLSVCPELAKRRIRDFSYSNLLYREVRCGIVHNYCLGNSTLPFSLTSREADISYVNMNIDGHRDRRIHFHFDWIAKLVLSVANSAAETEVEFPLPEPSSWWVEGKR